MNVMMGMVWAAGPRVDSCMLFGCGWWNLHVSPNLQNFVST